MQVFESREAAHAFAQDNGGGHIYRLFDYAAHDFEAVTRKNKNGRNETVAVHIKKGSARKYYGFHVTLFKNYPKHGR